jgi:Ni,Fe-hydrogenase III component G
MFTFKVIGFEVPTPHYEIEIRLLEQLKSKVGIDKFYTVMYNLGDSLFGEDCQSAFSAFAVYYHVSAENAPDWVKIAADADKDLYDFLQEIKTN